MQNILNRKINFFPLIDQLYSSSEGRVCELHFTTDEGSTKSEKMRAKNIDLRDETYHKAGKKAIGNMISCYRLSVIWEYLLKQNSKNNIYTYPEVFLPGKVYMLNQPESYLDEIIIKNCSGLQDYNFIISIIKKYMNI